MGRVKCCDPNCENSQQCDVKLFKFPLYNRQKLKKWLNSMKWQDWSPSSFSTLCIRHFEERYLDRTGRTVMLRENAVPTIFSVAAQHRKLTPVANSTENLTISAETLGKKQQASTSEASQTESAHAGPTTAPATDPSVENHESAESNKWYSCDLKMPTKGIVLMDEALARIHSFPYFFHGDYCMPQDTLWAPDNEDDFKIEHEDNRNVIEVQEPWQWLAMDVRGPLPQTQNEHKYIFTVIDLYSKWVEALPMQSCVSSHIAQHIADIVSHFGYPFRILSRLPRSTVDEINMELKNKLKITVPLLVYHHQTGTLDLMTQQLLDRMVHDLVQQHSCDWDVYLPAKVFALCLKEHPKTKERPFSLLCCKGLQPVTVPRGLSYTNSDIQDSLFVAKDV